jgi:hypothetical protein
MPLTTEQRVKAASVIAVIKIDAVHHDQGFVLKGFSDAEVITGIVGAEAGQKIRVWDDTRVDKDGKEWSIAGRDPYLEEGKTYFVYLTRNEKGRLVTVQSSLDSLEITGDQIDKEGGEGTESLPLKIKRIRELVAKIAKAQ